MTNRIGVLAGLVAVTFVVLLIVGPAAAEPDGDPNIQDAWVGKAKSKIYDTSTNGGREKEKAVIEAAIFQVGSELTVTISTPDDAGSPPFVVTGYIGNRRLFLSGEMEPGAPIVMVGKVSGSGNKIKGEGFSRTADGSEISEFKFKLKRD